MPEFVVDVVASFAPQDILPIGDDGGQMPVMYVDLPLAICVLRTKLRGHNGCDIPVRQS
jgi:hypothetical protein